MDRHLVGKTEYDHGFGDFCFSTAADFNLFEQQVPNFDWGENYPWLRNP